MPGLMLAFDTSLMQFDMALASGLVGSSHATDFMGDNELFTAITVSLFTDRLAPDDAALPEPSPQVHTDRRGWWGDYLSQTESEDPIGSLLWLLWREKDLPQVVARARQYAQEALAWLLTPRAGELRLSMLHVTAERVASGQLGIGVEAKRLVSAFPAAQEWNFLYDYENAALMRIEWPA